MPQPQPQAGPYAVHSRDNGKPSPSVREEEERHSLSIEITDTQTSIMDDRQFVKDTRSYEHNRQRLNKAMSFIKRKARKDHKALTATVCPRAVVPCEKDKRLRPDDMDPLRDVKIPDIESQVNQETGHLAIRTAVFMGEVKLLDLIAARKPRKVKERDFEVIPRLPSVIVLDEASDFDSEVDDSWEHVDKDDKYSIRKPSYAEVVSSTK